MRRMIFAVLWLGCGSAAEPATRELSELER
jgi:hypothetical protein